MEEHGSTYQPEHAGAPRRGRFRRETTAPANEPMMTPSEHRVVEALERSIDERLDGMLGEIERQATVLMREVAAEVWRTGAGDVRPEQERIVSLLSRDQAIKSLLASSDERFQSLAIRSARLEDDLTELATQGRVTREAIEASVDAVRQIADSPAIHGIDEIRTQLEQVEAHIAAAFAHLDERDRAITEGVLRQVRDHGDLISQETARISEAMQSYVQGGTEAMGMLAQRVEQHAEAFAAHDEQLAEHVAGRVGEAIAPVGEQLDTLSERVGIGARSQLEIQAALERMVDARMRSLAELIRSDSTALRRLIEERATAVNLGESDVAPLIASFEEHMKALTIATERQVQAMSRTAEQQVAALATATNATVERQVAEIEGKIDDRLVRMADTVSSRVAEVTDAAIAGALGRTLERMSSSAGALEGIDTMIAESQSMAEERAQQGRVELEQSLMGHVDDRMTAIARLIRSDNQRLAERLAATPQPGTSAAPAVDPELLRETLRTMKELQAGMASEMVGTMDARFRTVSDQLHTETQSTAEAMIKVAEVLGEKIDRLSVRVDEGYGQDLQVVIERMGDAIRAMSTTGRRYDVG
jgi:Tfp pilus assembly protein PilP